MREEGDPVADKRNDFSKGSISRAILGLALPMTAAQVVNILYSVIDRIYLGRIPDVGHLALSGLGVTMPIISILLAFANLCGMGGAPLCSIHRGKGENEEAERILGNSFALLMLLGIAVMGLVYLFKRPILYFFGASDVTYPYAVEYLDIYLLGTLFVMIGLGMNPFINSQGFGKVGMLTVVLGAAINIVLDPVFIFAFDMGVRGAALATVIAQFCSAVWVMAFLCGKRSILRLRAENLRLRAKRVGRILSLGLSGFIMGLTNSLVQIACNKTLSVYGGDLYVGIMTVGNSLKEIFFMATQGLTGGSQPVIGYHYGAGKYRRVRKAIRFTSLAAIGYSLGAWVLLQVLPGPLMSLFSKDAATISAGVPALRIYFSLIPFQAMQLAAQSTFVGLGKSRQAIFFSLLRKAFVCAPLVVILPALGMGTDGVFAGEALSQLIGGIACFTTMYCTVYRLMGKMPDRL